MSQPSNIVKKCLRMLMIIKLNLEFFQLFYHVMEKVYCILLNIIDKNTITEKLVVSILVTASLYLLNLNLETLETFVKNSIEPY